MATTPSLRLRAIALPAEHGSWGLTLEPILMGLLVAPSWGGLGLAAGVFGLFLLRWPLKIAQTSWRQKRRARMIAAIRIAALYALLAVASIAIGIWQTGWRPLWPLLLALPFGAVFFIYDTQSRSRSWQAELAGPVAFAATAASVALAGGWAVAPALALWAVLIARAVPSVLYVRARIRLDRGKAYDPYIALGAHVAALALVGWLTRHSWLPLPVLAVFALLLVRALVGLSRYRRRVPIKVIGIAELGWGLLTVLTVAVGYHL